MAAINGGGKLGKAPWTLPKKEGMVIESNFGAPPIQHSKTIPLAHRTAGNA
jgi:hypothetical protein